MTLRGAWGVDLDPSNGLYFRPMRRHFYSFVMAFMLLFGAGTLVSACVLRAGPARHGVHRAPRGKARGHNRAPRGKARGHAKHHNRGKARGHGKHRGRR